jgi:uncharacterized membrane protein YkvA (DUF1232 family)
MSAISKQRYAGKGVPVSEAPGRLDQIANSVRRELRVYRSILAHPTTPCTAKALLWIAVGYLLLPFDLIPDFVPILGQVDDAIIVPLLILAALKITPPEVIEDCRRRAA